MAQIGLSLVLLVGALLFGQSLRNLMIADTGIVTDWAFHGVTHAVADFSPSEWAPDEHPDLVETEYLGKSLAEQGEQY